MKVPRSIVLWLFAGWLGFLVLPWYTIDEGFFSSDWLPFYPWDADLAPAVLQVFRFDRTWLLPIALPLLAPLSILRRARDDPRYSRVLIASGASGLACVFAQGFAIGALGLEYQFLRDLFAGFANRQFGLGWGGALTCAAFVVMMTEGLAARGALRGDSFVTGALGAVGGLITLFVFYPVAVILLRAIQTEAGDIQLSLVAENLLSPKVSRVAWNSLLLATLCGIGTTLLGLAFALIATRTSFAAKRLLRGLTILPIITPPFVIGLAIILVFGRSGLVTRLLEAGFGIEASRYIFGLPGILLAQLLAFTPIAFLVLIGVVEGIGPSLEEAAQTLGATRWTTFRTVTLPLMRPGLANAFLLGFIESLADFGNPVVLGGSFDVLATDVYFAVAGAQNDVPRAAALAMILLAFTLAAFYAQRRWVGKKSYTTMTGKGDSGLPCPLPRSLEIPVKLVALPWAAFTLALYAMVLCGGFVQNFGHDNTLTFAHYTGMFGPDGAAWSSLSTTVAIAAISAPITAVLGILTAYLLARQQFAGHSAFEFGTMLSFAVPGTVIGVSYILAFNVPPVEMTGTGVILVACFVFRNMPVGIRAGLAGLSQIDKSLDEASLTLGANSYTTIRRVILPLLRPALIAALVYGFVRAMTAISAVVFLVSADYDLATTYILGRVENGEYGPAIAYASVLIVLMLAAIGSIQLLVGKRQIGRSLVTP